MFKTVETNKTLKKVIGNGYRKRKVFLVKTNTVQLNGTYWDGGSKSEFHRVNLDNFAQVECRSYAPATFGGPREAPIIPLMDNEVIVETGYFCGKEATATVYFKNDDIEQLLTA